MYPYFIRELIPWAALSFIVLCGSLLGALGLYGLPVSANTIFPEAQELNGTDKNFQELAVYVSQLAEEKGGEYAYDVLRVADLPSGTDAHLLGHYIGEVFYQQEGIDGISQCTHDFRNACSHQMVIGALLELGEGALDKMHDVCKQAPGGRGAYGMCFHGLGHGVLAYNDYDFPSTIAMCKRMGTEEYNGREYIECVGGAVMEILSGGDHDKDTWGKQREKYLTRDDPFSLCEAPFMEDKVSPICYMHLTPHLIGMSGGAINNPDTDDFDRAFELCKQVPRDETEDRDNCFAGMGKDLIVFANGRDVRTMDQMTNDELQQGYEWCQLADGIRDIASCVASAVQSLFWGGENDRGAAVRFCSLIETGEVQDTCVQELISAVGFYIDDGDYRRSFCSELPDAYTESCRGQMFL